MTWVCFGFRPVTTLGGANITGGRNFAQTVQRHVVVC